jgi:ergothioneine biosynthesis protein EgtB
MDIDAICERRARSTRSDPAAARAPEATTLPDRFREVRSTSLRLASGLTAEDQCVQSMPEASPTKWHLAHTSWFFEAMVLQENDPAYRAFDVRYASLFNSYYQSLGPRHTRALRGMLTRPGCDEIRRYRRHVDDAVEALLREGKPDAEVGALIELGLNHEQQHQELILTDIKHAFYLNPLKPAYRSVDRTNGQGRDASWAESTVELSTASRGASDPIRWIPLPGGVQEVGYAGSDFAFDNEQPRHQVLLRPFLLASRPVNCGEYLDFMLDGGYRRPELWLSDGWDAVQAHGWQAPLYWEPDGTGRFDVFTLRGMRPLCPSDPVCHISFYEACAYAAWAQARLPTEFEWEAAAARWPVSCDHRGIPSLDPQLPAAAPAEPLDPICGSVWQWTRSSYDPYPGFRPYSGPAGEYNGKFMVGQLVLRGGSCATPPGHIRATYRNFFPPGSRWQFSGLRLAKDA